MNGKDAIGHYKRRIRPLFDAAELGLIDRLVLNLIF